MVASERHWLAAACLNQNTYWLSRHPWARRPVAHGGWTAATDLRGLVAIRDGGAAAEPVSGEGDRDLSAGERKILADLLAGEPPADAHPCDVADLLEWCRHPGPRPCNSCKGTKEDRSFREAGVEAREFADLTGAITVVADGVTRIACSECDGTGTDAGHYRPGRVAGAVVDKLVLRRLLVGPVAESGCRMWATPTDGKHRDVCHRLNLSGVTADGLAWRVALMGLAHDADPMRDDPEVRYAPTYVPGVGALWHLIDEGGRGIVSDWLEDRGLDIERIHPLPF